MKNLFWNKSERRLKAIFRILVFLILAIVLVSIVGVFSDGLNRLAEKSLLNLFIMAAILVAIYISGKYIDKRPWSEFGITLLPLKDLLMGGLFGGVLMLFIFAIQFSMGWLSVLEIQYNSLATYPFIIVFFGQIIRYLSGSVLEESFSRGYLLRNIAEGLEGRLSKSQSVLFSYAFTSVLFGLLHLFNDNSSLLSTLNLFLLGLIFGLPVLRTGKLHFSIGLHGTWNIVQNSIFGAPNSGKMPISSIFLVENSGDSLWTGGDFGPEGGLICTAVLTLGFILLIYPYIFKSRQFHQKILN